MQIQAKTVNGVLVVTLEEKRLDSRLAVELKEKINELIGEGTSRYIVFDLKTVDFIDSSGIGCLVSCLKLLGSKGRIAMLGLTPPVEAMFKLTRMDKIFTICTTEEQALQAVSS
jgi:anti-sigma B factor antagonist